MVEAIGDVEGLSGQADRSEIVSQVKYFHSRT